MTASSTIEALLVSLKERDSDLLDRLVVRLVTGLQTSGKGW